LSSYIFKVNELEKYKLFLQKVKKANHAVILNSEDTMLLNIIAKLLVMSLECDNNNPPCLICNNCQKIIDNNALDVLWFGSEKSIVVEDSETIVQESFVVPYEFKNKYFVLQNFENATQQAQNKLLKIIEEPQKFDKYIILASNLDAVLSTIKSRCEIFDVPRFSAEELKTIFNFEAGNGKKVSFGAEYATGSLTKLNSIYNDEDFAEIYSLCIKLLTNLKTSANLLEYSTQILKYKIKIELVLEILSSLYRDILVIKNGEINLVQNKEQLNILMVLANDISDLSLVNIINEIQIVKQKLKFNASVSGVIDNLLLKILEIKHICK